MASLTTARERVVIPKFEYQRLKKLEKRFGDFLSYLDYISQIREARRQVEQKKVIPQEKLFKKLGL